jgi:hypothetical protein
MNPFGDKGIEVQTDRYGARFIHFHPRRKPFALVILGGLTLVFLGVGLAGFLGGLFELRIEYATLPFLFGGLFLLSILLWLLFNTARFTVGGGKIVLRRTCLAFQRIQTRSVGDFKILYFESFYELIDLVRFVSELGKPGAYETRNVPVVRRWRSVLSEEMAAPGVPDIVETPLYSLVSGDLPLEGLPTDDFNRAKVRCEIEVTTPGKILFKFNNTDGLRMWIDNEEIEPHSELVTELGRGKHSALFQIKLDKRETPLRLEVTETPESAGRVQVVSGR